MFLFFFGDEKSIEPIKTRHELDKKSKDCSVIVYNEVWGKNPWWLVREALDRRPVEQILWSCIYDGYCG